jgi:membrane protein
MRSDVFATNSTVRGCGLSAQHLHRVTGRGRRLTNDPVEVAAASTATANQQEPPSSGPQRSQPAGPGSKRPEASRGATDPHSEGSKASQPGMGVGMEVQRPVRLAWQLIRETARSSVGDRVSGLAAEAAFFMILSVPPALLALLGGIGYVGPLLGEGVVDEIRRQAVSVAETFLTGSATRDVVEPTVNSILREGRGGIVSLGLALALWSASRATTRMIEAVAIAYELEDRRSAWRRRALALVMTVVGIAVVVIVLPVLVAGPRFLEALPQWLGIGEALAAAWRFLYWPIVGLVGVGMLASFFHWAAPWRTPWRRDLPGAVLAAVSWLALGAGLRVYASRFIEGGVFGSLAAPIVFLLWLYVTALAVLIGAELNAEIEKLWPTREMLEQRGRGTRGKQGWRRVDRAGGKVPVTKGV